MPPKEGTPGLDLMLSWMSQNMARISDDTASRDAVERGSEDDEEWVEWIRGDEEDESVAGDDSGKGGGGK